MPETSEPRARGKAWRIAFLLIGLAVLATMAVYAMNRRGSPDQGGDGGSRFSATQEQAFRDGMANLRELAGTEMAGAVGLASRADAERARPGPAFAVYVIRLDELRNYNSGTPAQSLLHELPMVVVPLLIDGEVRSSMTISRSERGFTATAFGDRARVQPAAEARGRGLGDFIVRVPALGVEFLGRGTGSELTLTLLSADPRLQAASGQPLAAAAALQQLVPLARALQDDAPM